MNLIERLAAWVWDHTGSKQAAQRNRLIETERKVRRNLEERERALDQIRRTQEFVREESARWRH